jgi:hypothetical protein
MWMPHGLPFPFGDFRDDLCRSVSMPHGIIPLSRTDPTQAQVKKVKWTEREDQILTGNVQKYGTSNWSLIACALPGRTGKQCRERWTNQLDPSLNRDNWTSQEDTILLFQQNTCGNCWSKISHFLPRRSANAIKNRWCWLTRHRSHAPGDDPAPPQPPPAPPPAPKVMEPIRATIQPAAEPEHTVPEWLSADACGKEPFGQRDVLDKASDPFGVGLSEFSWE